ATIDSSRAVRRIATVTEAAQQAAGPVAVPAAALTAITLLGWVLKPAAIKAAAGVAGRNG
ncbi:MAG: hypothetical protein OEY55_11690, partial [Acidimicrobiia bacterium]|nr:hypothetical protein [Acidimicrobiia bacterium]